MAEQVKKRPLVAWILIILMVFLGIAAVISGAMLFGSPNGDLMGMSTDILEDSPFSNYLIPGIILFVFVGIFPLLISLGLINTKRQFFRVLNPLKGFHWAWTGTIAESLILLIWIITETALLGYISFLQPVMAVWAIVLVALALLPGVRWYYTSR